MNALDFFVKLYAPLHNYPHIPMRVLTPFRMAVRFVAWHILPRYLAKSKIMESVSQVPVTVSLTSFPARIGSVWQVVECMMSQTYRPERIVLWLSKDQFPDTMDSLPQSLLQRQGELFAIRWVEGDIRSHKKYYYIAKESPDAWVLLIDDDIYYDTHLIERVWKEHLAHPEAVICNFGRHIRHREDGSLEPYTEWPYEFRRSEAEDLFFGSGGGTLFRPAWLYGDLLDISNALRVCPIADDIWLNAMVRLAGRKILILRNGNILPVIYGRGKTGLFRINGDEAKNDEQIAAINEYYGKQIF